MGRGGGLGAEQGGATQMNSESQQVVTVDCTTAKEFLDAIAQPLSETGPPDFRNPWVYRGHGDASWKLKPAAWREESGTPERLIKLQNWVQLKFDKMDESKRSIWFNSQSVSKWAVRWATEFIAVRQFCELADEIGLAIPNADHFPTVDKVLGFLASGNCGWVDGQSFWHIPTAFAQHHGIATRFLDWTRNPLYAAFFAVEGVPQPEKTGSPLLCVWAVNSKGTLHDLEWITVPRGHHPFVHAQDSLFSVHRYADTTFQNNGTWPVFQDTFTQPDPEARVIVPLRQWTLPQTLAGELRTELFARGIGRSRLMPTLDRVADDTMLRWTLY
jgi:hypothetical protein